MMRCASTMNWSGATRAAPAAPGPDGALTSSVAAHGRGGMGPPLRRGGLLLLLLLLPLLRQGLPQLGVVNR